VSTGRGKELEMKKADLGMMAESRRPRVFGHAAVYYTLLKSRRFS
jgi:hypothetical protein